MIGLGIGLAGCQDTGISIYTVPKEPNAVQLTVIPPTWHQRSESSFDIISGGLKAQASVVFLTGSGGGLLANINRWQQQIGAPLVPESELPGLLKNVKMGPRTFHSVYLVGPKETIVGYIYFGHQGTWFFKLKGDKTLVIQNKASFLALLRGAHFDG